MSYTHDILLYIHYSYNLSFFGAFWDYPPNNQLWCIHPGLSPIWFSNLKYWRFPQECAACVDWSKGGQRWGFKPRPFKSDAPRQNPDDPLHVTLAIAPGRSPAVANRRVALLSTRQFVVCRIGALALLIRDNYVSFRSAQFNMPPRGILCDLQPFIISAAHFILCPRRKKSSRGVSGCNLMSAGTPRLRHHPTPTFS